MVDSKKTMNKQRSEVNRKPKQCRLLMICAFTIKSQSRALLSRAPMYR